MLSQRLMLTMKIITTLTFFILLHSSFTFANTHLIKINKSHIDSADYRYLTLSNGLKVVLIQKYGDSILNLTVNAGSIDDPDNYLGLAHYLEHMLHLGTTKHPRPDEYLNFIREKGGSLDALTFATQTQYQLSLPNQFFTEGIDRFSELFKSPLLNKKMAIKELNAVNSEWLQKKNTLAYNLHRTNSANMRSQSPFSRFMVGNNDILLKNGIEALQTQLNVFFTNNYIAENMNLVISADIPFDQLSVLAEQYFGNISSGKASKNLSSFKSNETKKISEAYKGYLQKHIFLKTKTEQPQLHFQFPINQPLYSGKSYASEFLKLVFSGQEENTLIRRWQDQGLISHSDVSLSQGLSLNDGQIVFAFSLTQKGVVSEKQMINDFFNYLSLLTITAKESNDLTHIRKNFSISEYVFGEPKIISRLLGHVPIQNLLLRDPYQTELSSILSYLTPTNVRIWHISNEQKTDNQLSWASGSYRETDITDKELINDQKNINQFTLPFLSPNYVVSTQEKLPLKEIKTNNFKNFEKYKTNSLPTKVLEQPGIRAYLSHITATWSVGHIELNMINQTKTDTIQKFIYGKLLQQLLFNRLARLFEKECAAYLHSCSQLIRLNAQGKLSLVIEAGIENTPFHLQLLESLVIAYQQASFSIDDYKEMLFQYLNQLKSIESVPQQAWLALQSELHHVDFKYALKEQLQAIDKLNFNDFKEYLFRLKNNNYIDIFYSGYYHEKDVHEHAIRLKNSLAKYSPSQKKLSNQQGNNPFSGQKKLLIKNKYQGNGYLNASVINKNNSRNKIIIHVIAQFLQTEFFNAMRTDLQLGYSVNSSIAEVNNSLLFCLFIENFDKDIKTIEKNVLDFKNTFYTNLQKMSDKEFDFLLTSVINSLGTRNGFILNDWRENNLTFDSYDKFKAMPKITLSEVTAFYQKEINSKQSVSRTILLQSNNKT